VPVTKFQFASTKTFHIEFYILEVIFVLFIFVHSSTYRLLLLTTKVRAQPGVPRLICASALMVDSASHQMKATQSTLIVDLFTWDAHVREVTQEGSVTVTLTPAR